MIIIALFLHHFVLQKLKKINHANKWPNQTKPNVTKQRLQKEKPKVLLKVRFSGPIWQKLILFAFNVIFGI